MASEDPAGLKVGRTFFPVEHVMMGAHSNTPDSKLLQRAFAVSLIISIGGPFGEVCTGTEVQGARTRDGATAGKQEHVPASQNHIEIRSVIPARRRGPHEGETQRAVSHSIRYSEFERLAKSLPMLKYAIPIRAIPKQVHSVDRIVEARVIGTTGDYGEFLGSGLQRGRFLDRVDDSTQGNRVVLGQNIAEALFPNQDPVGRSIKIGTDDFTVLGVARREDPVAGTQQFDKNVYIPLSVSRARFGEEVLDQGQGGSQMIQLTSVLLVFNEGTNLSHAAARVRDALRPFHPRDDVEVVVVQQARVDR